MYELNVWAALSCNSRNGLNGKGGGNTVTVIWLEQPLNKQVGQLTVFMVNKAKGRFWMPYCRSPITIHCICTCIMVVRSSTPSTTLAVPLFHQLNTFKALPWEEHWKWLTWPRFKLVDHDWIDMRAIVAPPCIGAKSWSLLGLVPRHNLLGTSVLVPNGGKPGDEARA